MPISLVMPAKKRFTETWLKSLLDRPPEADTTYSEAGRVGFVLRHRTGGTLAFVARYQRNGKPDWLTIGEYPALTLEQAHEAHAEVRKQLANGLDPKAERERLRIEREREQQRRKVTEGITVRSVIAEWAWWHARRKEPSTGKRRRKNPREAVRLLKVHLLVPHLKDKPAANITKRDLVMVIDKVIARDALVMANRIRDLIVQVFAFAASRDLIPSSPAAGLLRKPGGEEASRERVLSRDEIRVVWAALDDPKTKMSLRVRLALKLILATAQRGGEVSKARLDEFDISSRVWTIPADVAKNEKEHSVPLTDLAIELLHELRLATAPRTNRKTKAMRTRGPFLLPTEHVDDKPDQPISERALSRALKNNHTGDDDNPKLFGLLPFTPHDLRRTASTMMTSLGIPRLHVSKVINHTSGEHDETPEIAGVYDRHNYWPEKVRALTVWEAELRNIISTQPSNACVDLQLAMTA